MNNILDIPSDVPIVFLTVHEVRRRTGMGTTFIYEEMKAERFPQAVKVGKRATRWIEAEIDAWCKARVNATRATPDEQAA
ncbi:helix-turn-helix transcriptional regulator [Pseudomonas citronellolis]|uniref:helix-turn-helix transcriptional regulator n=1 Tax=Pseudomonas citronellolis TaxID=53408 RepID=UPI002D787B20|nr:AlpA family phage regulatory protein [Pseudomonas citronellolis]WRT82777.1 AlpA family phage regulatory protein [Pseudomonas citronellolis]